MPFEFPAWDPVLLDLPGPFAIRWYGLMYLVGFWVGHLSLKRLIRLKFLPMQEESVWDLIVFLVLGVLFGGRIGYVLFYQVGAGDTEILTQPMRWIAVWEGGLAFHGGLLGVAVAVIWFARTHKIPILRLGDAVAIATCPGILAVRIANFINGELYGRPTDPETFGAMRFPTDTDYALPQFGVAHLGLGMEAREAVVQYAVRHKSWDDVAGSLPAQTPSGDPIDWASIRPRLDWDAVKENVPFRHPSQLYEGFSEGLLLGIVLWVVVLRTRLKPFAQGVYFGLFLLGYGVARSLIENLRQPDSQFRGDRDDVGFAALGLTMGQILSFGMLLVGAWLAGRVFFLPRAEPVGAGSTEASASQPEAPSKEGAS